MLAKSLRTAWADYFDKEDVKYIFWSAKAASEGVAEEGGTPFFKHTIDLSNPMCK